MTPPRDTLGLIGLGRMGIPIARRLLDAGHRLMVWDRDPARVAALVAAGALEASGPADFTDVSILISVVLDDAGTLEVATAMRPALPAGAIHVVMATIAPDTARTLATLHAVRDQRYVSAPMFGRPDAAVEGRLTIICSGNEAASAVASRLFAPLGTTRWVGVDPGLAMLVKLAGNNLIFGVVELMDEVFALLGSGGMEASAVKRDLVDQLLPGDVFQGYARRRLDDDRATDLRRVSGKDHALCLDAGRAAGTDLPLIEALGRILFGREG